MIMLLHRVYGSLVAVIVIWQEQCRLLYKMYRMTTYITGIDNYVPLNAKSEGIPNTFI